MTTHTVTVEPRKPARAAGANTARRELCWADHPVTELNFHCLQLAAPTPDLGLCPGHLEEIFGLTAEGCGQGLRRVP